MSESSPTDPAVHPSSSKKPFPMTEAIVFLGIVAIILMGAFFFLNAGKTDVTKAYMHTFNDPALNPDVWLVSNQAEPGVFIGQLNKSLKTVLVFKLSENTSLNTKMGETLILFQSVMPLLSKDAKVVDQNLITLIEVHQNGSLKDCTTDFGVPGRQITLSATDCSSFLGRTDQFVIESTFSDSSLNTNLVEFSDQYVRLKTYTPDALPATALALLEAMNPKTRGFIQLVNLQISGIGSTRSDGNFFR